MKIIFENEIKPQPFGNIAVGECFIDGLNTSNQIICMKIEGSNNEIDNAVDLEDGEVLSYDYDEEVTPISIEVKVRLGG